MSYKRISKEERIKNINGFTYNKIPLVLKRGKLSSRRYEDDDFYELEIFEPRTAKFKRALKTLGYAFIKPLSNLFILFSLCVRNNKAITTTHLFAKAHITFLHHFYVKHSYI